MSKNRKIVPAEDIKVGRWIHVEIPFLGADDPTYLARIERVDEFHVSLRLFAEAKSGKLIPVGYSVRHLCKMLNGIKPVHKLNGKELPLVRKYEEQEKQKLVEEERRVA